MIECNYKLRKNSEKVTEVENMEYTSVRNKEICITVEKAQRSDKVVVWGCFYGKDGSSFQRYFENMEKAMIYYNKQLEKGIRKYMEKCEMILNK